MAKRTWNLGFVRRFPPQSEIDPTARLEAVLAPILEELAATPPNKELNVGIRAAVATVRAALPRLRTLRAQLAELPAFDLERFDRLELYVNALAHCHAWFFKEPYAPRELQGAVWRAARLRHRLNVVNQELVRRGALDASQRPSATRCVGYGNLSFDLQHLQLVLGDARPEHGWPSSALVPQLARARQSNQALCDFSRFRKQTSEDIWRVYTQRERAMTLLVRTYQQARRAVLYLRHHQGDADLIAPPLDSGTPRAPNARSSS
jgi:hypothetical protein